MKLKLGTKLLGVMLVLGIFLSFSVLAFANPEIEGVTEKGNLILISAERITEGVDKLSKVTSNHGWTVTTYSSDESRKGTVKKIESVEIKENENDNDELYVYIYLEPSSRILAGEIFEVQYKTPRDTDKAIRTNGYNIYTPTKPFVFPNDNSFFKKDYNKSDIKAPQANLVDSFVGGMSTVDYVYNEEIDDAEGNFVFVKIAGELNQTPLYNGHGWAISSAVEGSNRGIKKEIEFVKADGGDDPEDKTSWIAIKLDDKENIAQDEKVFVTYKKPRDIDKAMKIEEGVFLENVSNQEIVKNASKAERPNFDSDKVSITRSEDLKEISLTFEDQKFAQVFLDGWKVFAAGSKENLVTSINYDKTNPEEKLGDKDYITLQLSEAIANLDVTISYKPPRNRFFATENEYGLVVKEATITGSFTDDKFSKTEGAK